MFLIHFADAENSIEYIGTTYLENPNDSVIFVGLVAKGKYL